MIIEFLQKNSLCRKILYRIERHRAERIINLIKEYLQEGDRILDVGAGTCIIAEVLEEKGFDLTPLDIRNLSFSNRIEPVIYDGRKIPFEDDSFDVALVLVILHHTSNPEAIIKEVKRVSKRIIIMEDIYLNTIHKYLTFFMCSLLNLEFRGHPHSNKDDKGWRATFGRFGLRIEGTKYVRSCLVIKHGIYYLKK